MELAASILELFEWNQEIWKTAIESGIEKQWSCCAAVLQ